MWVGKKGLVGVSTGMGVLAGIGVLTGVGEVWLRRISWVVIRDMVDRIDSSGVSGWLISPKGPVGCSNEVEGTARRSILMGDLIGWGIRERRDASVKVKDGDYRVL